MTETTNAPAAESGVVVPTVRFFAGTSTADQQAVSGQSFTPDSNGAANYAYFVEFINYVFSVYDKQTGSLAGPRVSGTQFWAAAGIPSPGNIIDPRIVFIPDAGRYGQWLAIQVDLGFRVLIATTDPNDLLSDPRLGRWRASEFALPGNDFPMLGYDAKGIYIGDDNSPGQNQPRLPQIVFIPRLNALAYPPQVGPDVIKVTKYGDLKREVYGDSLYPMIDASGAGWPYETAIGVDNITKRHLTFALISPQFGEILSVGKIDVEPFEPVPSGYRVKQPAASAYNAVIWANNGLVAAPMGGGFDIWLAQTVLNLKYRSLAVRWYHLFIDPMSRMPGLSAWGEIFQVGYDHFNPSILSFGKGDYTVVSLSRSGDFSTPTDPNNPACGNIGAYAALVREGAQPQIVTLKSGQASDYFPPGGQRWGDYSTICRDPDPKHPRRAWITGQYVLQGQQQGSQWGNAIASIELA